MTCTHVTASATNAQKGRHKAKPMATPVIGGIFAAPGVDPLANSICFVIAIMIRDDRRRVPDPVMITPFKRAASGLRYRKRNHCCAMGAFDLPAPTRARG